MSKIGIILKREYLNKVRNKTFIILTLLGPILYGLVMALPIIFASFSDETSQIYVVDESGIFANKLKGNKKIEFVDSKSDFNTLKKEMELGDKGIDNILFIPKETNAFKTNGITIFSNKTLGLSTSEMVENTIEKEVRLMKLSELKVSKTLIDSLDSRVYIQSKIITEKGTENSSTGTAFIVGMGSGFFMYFFIFLYGGLILRSVQEEKQNRVIEVLISSVKPFDLMMGKILALALVGLTQFAIWGALSSIVSAIIIPILGGGSNEVVQSGAAIATNPQSQMGMQKVMSALGTLNFPLIIGCFVFYFLGGYLLYSALFAAAAAAADSQQDTQQFMFPVSIPIIISIITLTAVVNAPQGGIAVFLSIFPLTSPISMMARIGFDVPLWQLFLSMFLLIITFISAVWFAAKIYRIGILMYGKKVSWKEVMKWLRYS